MRFLIIFFLFCGICYAGTNKIDDMEFTYDDKYSLKDYTDKTLLDVNPEELEGITIFGSCFSKEIPDTKVFPDTIKKLTLINCNLDNVYIKPQWRVIGGTRKKFKAQNDLEDWFVDNNNNPIEPLEKEKFLELGISTDPKNIPKQKLPNPIREYYEKKEILPITD